MVQAFNDWCFAEDRKVGDTGLVETDYGWHVMYYDGDSETTYRDFLITNDMKEADTTAWYDAEMEKVTVEILDDSHIQKDLVLSNG